MGTTSAERERGATHRRTLLPHSHHLQLTWQRRRAGLWIQTDMPQDPVDDKGVVEEGQGAPSLRCAYRHGPDRCQDRSVGLGPVQGRGLVSPGHERIEGPVCAQARDGGIDRRFPQSEGHAAACSSSISPATRTPRPGGTRTSSRYGSGSVSRSRRPTRTDGPSSPGARKRYAHPAGARAGGRPVDRRSCHC